MKRCIKNPSSMKRFLSNSLVILSTLFVFASCKKEAVPAGNEGTNNKPETQPAIQTAVNASISSNIGGFYRALPARYDSGTGKYPLLIFLHGADETGNGTSDLPKILVSGVTKLLNQKAFPAQFTVHGATYSFIVISPQCKQWPQPSDINSLIDYAIKNLRVDTNRIYVAGWSMGGGGTWDYAIAYPERVAAIVPISGASWPSREQCGSIAKSNLPVWAFHNSDDATVAASATATITEHINSFRPAITAQKTIWTSGGHDASTKATDPSTKECGGKNMYEWMLQYSRKKE